MIKSINRVEYERLLDGATLLKKRAGRPGVLLIPNGKIVKLIYKSSLFSLSRSRRVWRMLRNAKKLAVLNIPSITIEQCYYYPTRRCYIIIYPKVSGNPVANITKEMLKFIAKLHTKGVYFHDLLAKNILYCNDADFAIIDIDLMDIYKASLPISTRAKNLSFFIIEDYLKVHDFGLDKLVNCYLEYSDLTKANQEKFKQELQQQLLLRTNVLQSKIVKLKQLGITAQAPDAKANYIEVSGKSVKELLINQKKEILTELAKFFVYLHLHGVFTSSINFAAIIRQQNKRFAFQDIQWIEKMQNKPLSLKKRVRSLSGVIRIESEMIETVLGIREFINCYLRASAFTERRKVKFNKFLQQKLLKRGNIKI